jgi:hypothetical protein
MNRKSMLTIVIATVWLAVLGGLAISAQDKHTVKVPGGSRSLSSGDTKHGRLSPSGRANAPFQQVIPRIAWHQACARRRMHGLENGA